MQNLRMMLMSGVATMSLAAAPALAQQDTAPDAAGGDQMAQGEVQRNYDETYGAGDTAAWGDRTVDELLGTDVVNDAGESIGQIDDFGLAGEDLVAIVGIGGFLGLGSHDVAIPIDSFVLQGEQLVLPGMTREELEALPEYDEATAQSFAGDQTLRSGYEVSEVAMQQGDMPAEEPMQTAEEEVAEAEEEAAEAESPEMAEGESADPMPEGMETAETDTAEEPAAGEGAEIAETDAAEEPADGEGAEMAETDAAEPAAGEGAEMAEGEVTGESTTDSTTGESTEMAATEEQSGWTEEMDQIFADIADREIAELIGMEVAGADGNVVGEVDNFALEGEDVVAIIGVGGFLGIGEHDVALPLGDMTFDGERLVLSSMTEDQLREMPEYDSNEANQLPQDGTLRSSYSQ